MDPGLVDTDLLGVSPVLVGDEDRIPGFPGEIDDALMVGRPGRPNAIRQKHVWRPTNGRHEPDAMVPAVGGVDAEPRMDPVAGKPDVMNERVGQGRLLSLGEVQELAAADLTYPGVERALVVREKRHEFAVVGDARIQLGAFPGCEATEGGTGEGVLPGSVADDPKDHAHRDDNRSL